MSDPKTTYPEYESLEDRLLVANLTLTPAYIHGIMLGVLCTGEEDPVYAWQEIKTEVLPLGNLSEESDAIFLALLTKSLEDLKDLGEGVNPLLVGEENNISDRLASLSEWCEGFLQGINIGIGLAKILIPLETFTEVLEDFASIKDVEIDEESNEENEKSYQELLEFIRVGALLIHAECQEAKHQDNENMDKIH